MLHPRNNDASLIIRSRRVVFSDRIAPACLHLRDGVICKIGQWNEIEPAAQLFDAGDQAVLPGAVDIHTHINEPGRGDWEGFESATRAAAAGGITTLLDMPLNSIPPATSAGALARKIESTAGKLWIDVGFHGGIVPGNDGDLRPLVQSGVAGLKCFLCDSGVDEFPAVTPGQLADAIGGLAGLDPWILVHAESSEILDAAQRRISISPTRGAWTYEDYLRSRPDEAEYRAIEQLIELAERFRARIHIVHLSSATALALIARAKAEGLAMTAETCPHYLTFDAESIADGATELKCAPPIRAAGNRDKLWQGLRDGVIDVIASDHSPCLPELKTSANGNFAQAWGGIASLQCSLAAVWTEAQQRCFTLSDLVRWMCEGPARLARLPSKGSLSVGKDADLICFAPEEEYVLQPADIYHRHRLTPYLGRRLRGVVKRTFLRGVPIYDRGLWSGAPRGRIIRAQPRIERDNPNSTASR
jgi:allantoinase